MTYAAAHAPLRKIIATACAEAALLGIVATPSRNDRGEPTIVLTRGAWTREIRPDELAEALAQARALLQQEVAQC
ncbi:hypothetical protein HHL11_07135 [Ramlibacter sp. G-1-2-2]|uniref:Uncharacterized protein n=1 Tax=Ramlibacter agri TaxID=2728837 RepID=A0A848GXW4_9BURK|nr:hypothetical protein [Ramlibacter agri]NML43516.1 hypothetical protein [Ramlibacter agri]